MNTRITFSKIFMAIHFLYGEKEFDKKKFSKALSLKKMKKCFFRKIRASGKTGL